MIVVFIFLALFSVLHIKLINV